MAAWNGQKVEPLAPLKSFLGKLSSKPAKMWREMKALGNEYPKRAVHSIKVLLALTIVSLFYYFRPLYDYFGDNATWAIFAVVVVFEFSVGAKLSKGLNRMTATTVAGAVGLAAYGIAHRSGKTAELFLLGFFVFIMAGLVTFLRFFPGMKARYDYGPVVFNLTFFLVSFSGYRETSVVKMAFQRVLTVILGGLTVMGICLCICPAWSGHELHDLIASNMEKLGDFLEGFAAEYCEEQENGQRKKDYEASLTAYRRVLNSKDNEETMANLARWEPCHGRFEFRHPWKQYLRIGTLIRECAYRIESLSLFLDFQNQNPLSICGRVQEPFTRISTESGRFLKELGSAIQDMTLPPLVDHWIANFRAASDDLKSFLASAFLREDDNLFKICQVTAMSLVLIETVTCLENISDAVDELASLANFKGLSEPAAAKVPKPQRLQPVLHLGTVQPFPADAEHHGHIVTLTVEESPAKINAWVNKA